MLCKFSLVFTVRLHIECAKVDDKLYGWTGETRPSVITCTPVLNEITGSRIYGSNTLTHTALLLTAQ